MINKKVTIIGAGFGGVTAAAFLAKKGFKVTVIEKNSQAGGRAGQIKEKGFTFDIGPSWYMIPEVYEQIFNDLGKKRSDYFEITKIDPSYRVYFEEDKKFYNIPADPDKLMSVFEILEKGSSPKIKQFLKKAEFKYKIAFEKYLYKNFENIFQLLNLDLILNGLKLQLYKSIESEVKKYTKDKKIIQLLTWHTVFLGGSPKNIPSLYSLMAYADFYKNTWYPKGGFYNVAHSIQKIAEEYGAKFIFGENVTGFEFSDNKIKQVLTNKQKFGTDFVLGNADYHHIETKLLPTKYNSYDQNYWEKRKLGCSTFVICLGINKKLKNLEHHNYYFTKDWENHFETIFEKPEWPKDPSIYFSAVSKTDSNIAPKNNENLFILVPVASGLDDNQKIKEEYSNKIIKKVESIIGENFSNNIIVKKIISQSDQKNWYNAYKGNSLGLAHTLWQTAFLRPSIKSKKVANLFFAGQYTQPGTSVAISMISGQLAANEIIKLN